MKSPSRAAAAPAPVIQESSAPSAFRWIAAHPQLMFLLLPAVLFWFNPNWPFQGLGHMDPWYYFGNIQHFPKYHNLFPAYYGERMTWIAPGVLFVHLFGPVAGVVLLHVATYTISLLLFHGILKQLTDARTAFCATLLLG